MSILVFGKTGQVATELRASGNVTALGRAEVDLTRPDHCAAAIENIKPSVVINAAAYTAVDKAEEDETTAQRVNADAPGAMARACAKTGARLLHISTDYVFDGSGSRPWTPDDPVAPLGVYGRTKLAGEQAIRSAECAHVILRTSWVFSAHGANFVKTMLRLGAERDKLTVVSDQIGGPTSAASIAAALLHIAQTPGPSGVYHFAGAPAVSWADFARNIFCQSDTDCAVEDILSEAYPTPAKRPHNSRLNCAALKQDYGIDQPDWRADLRDVLTALA